MNTNNENEKKGFNIMIDNKPFNCKNQFIGKAEICQLGNIPENYDVFLKINGPGEDEQLEKDTRVDLSLSGREHFYS